MLSVFIYKLDEIPFVTKYRRGKIFLSRHTAWKIRRRKKTYDDDAKH